MAARAFIPLQAIFICFTAMLLVMAFQRCFWIAVGKGEKETGVEDEIWLGDDTSDDSID